MKTKRQENRQAFERDAKKAYKLALKYFVQAHNMPTYEKLGDLMGVQGDGNLLRQRGMKYFAYFVEQKWMVKVGVNHKFKKLKVVLEEK